MENDWRLSNQFNYLYKSKLIRTTFKKTNTNDHEHCEFCWDKFSEEDNDLHEGYCTLDKCRWICDNCYNDFNQIFRWELINN